VSPKSTGCHVSETVFANLVLLPTARVGFVGVIRTIDVTPPVLRPCS
jgi:hypothetical protein